MAEGLLALKTYVFGAIREKTDEIGITKKKTEKKKRPHTIKQKYQQKN